VGFNIAVIAPAFEENPLGESPLGEFEGEAGLFQPVVNRVVHSPIIVGKDKKGKRGVR
jgi:hypothetical protein